MLSIEINRNKAEAPIMATFFLTALFISIYFYPTFYWFAFLGFPLFFVIYMFLSKNKLAFFKRNAFLILDDEGVKYCFHLYQQPKSLKWEQVEKVNYQMYEINLKLKENGQIICFQTSYLKHPTDVDKIIAKIKEHCETM